MKMTSDLGLRVVASTCVALLALSCSSKPSVYLDYGRALRHLRAIEGAESAFFLAHGHYANLEELWGRDLDPVKRSVATGTFDEFHFEVKPNDTGYSLSIWPASNKRIVSLYADQGGVVRIALRGARATETSEVIRDNPE